ncbi:SICAvar, type I (fragment) [Plasmodium knowlesi strain H]|uniref:SICAvar, type I n=2 Tax=Plasmodium knowlesi (strain H) TaxID=5851 RepID=A0A193QS98_PLAKH
MEQVQNSSSRFRGGDFTLQEDSQSSNLGFKEEDFFFDDEVEGSDSGFREEDFILEEDVIKEQIANSSSGFREEDFILEKGASKEEVPLEEVPLEDGPKKEVPKKEVPKEEAPSQSASWVTYWVNWIERNKGVLEEVKTQPWFHNLRVDWKEHQKQQDAEKDELKEENDSSCAARRKKDAWRKWIAKQHALMDVNSEQDWFKHLLENVEEVEQDESEQQGENEHKTGEGTESTTSAYNNLPRRQQLHKNSNKKNFLITKLWMLILALVFEECERERTLHEKEMYVDHLLENTLA